MVRRDNNCASQRGQTAVMSRRACQCVINRLAHQRVQALYAAERARLAAELADAEQDGFAGQLVREWAQLIRTASST